MQRDSRGRPCFRSVVASLFVGMVAGLGCSRPAPNAETPLKDVQEYYSSSKWYWSAPEGLPEQLENFKRLEDGRRVQVVLVSPEGDRSVGYTELKRSKHLKAFHGSQTLRRSDGVDVPLYRSDGDGLIGFFDRRAFRIEIIAHGADPQAARRQAISLGVEIIEANRD